MKTFNVKLRIWLDDERDPEDPYIQEDFHSEKGMVWAKTEKEATQLLKMGNVEFISFDHDLGPPAAGTGYGVAKWIEEQAFKGNLPQLSWTVHTQNPIGGKRIISAMLNADKFWGENEKKS